MFKCNEIHVICYEGPEWCEPLLVLNTTAKKAQRLADQMNNEPAEFVGKQFPELSRFVVKKNIPFRKV